MTPARRLWVPFLAIALYGILLIPVVRSQHYDLSALIDAGDFWVDVHLTASPIIVGHHSFGYDGQFYYRLATDPFSVAPMEHGVRLDDPTYRMGRIFYPLLVWAVTFGNAALVPAGMLAVNLLALGAIGGLSVELARAADLSPVVPAAIILCPGFFATLTHDTTEIVASAFLLAAILLHMRGRFAGYALCGAAATLTRETTAVVLFGLLVSDVARWRGRLRAILCGASLLIPILAWHRALPVLWHVTGSGAAGQNIGWPFAGALEAVRSDVSALWHWRSPPASGRRWRSVALFVAVGTIGFCAASAARLPALFRNRSISAIALGWIFIAGLMSTLTANGPWIDSTATTRAFTECWIVGCLVLGAARPPMPRPLLGVLPGFCVAVFFCMVWVSSRQFGVQPF